MGSTPATGLKLPSKLTSPKNKKSPNKSGLICSDAAKIPILMGRSKLGPSLRKSAGVKLITILRMGKAYPAFFKVAFTRSRDS